MLELDTTLQGEMLELPKANNKVGGADDPRIPSALLVCNDTRIAKAREYNQKTKVIWHLNIASKSNVEPYLTFIILDVFAYSIMELSSTLLCFPLGIEALGPLEKNISWTWMDDVLIQTIDKICDLKLQWQGLPQAAPTIIPSRAYPKQFWEPPQATRRTYRRATRNYPRPCQELPHCLG